MRKLLKRSCFRSPQGSSPDTGAGIRAEISTEVGPLCANHEHRSPQVGERQENPQWKK